VEGGAGHGNEGGSGASWTVRLAWGGVRVRMGVVGWIVCKVDAWGVSTDARFLSARWAPREFYFCWF